jgi:hypothetical protein
VVTVTKARKGDESRGHQPPTRKTSLLRELRHRLAAISNRLGRDELAVLVLVAERLRVGRRRYGALRVDNDPRDFQREALEEAADLAVYAMAGLLRDDERDGHDRRKIARREREE